MHQSIRRSLARNKSMQVIKRSPHNSITSNCLADSLNLFEYRLESQRHQLQKGRNSYDKSTVKFQNLKTNLGKDRRCQSDENEICILKNQLDRTSVILKSKVHRLGELNNKLVEAERQLQQMKPLALKNAELKRASQVLGKKMNSQLRQLQSKQAELDLRNYEVQTLKAILAVVKSKVSEEDQSRAEAIQKDRLVGSLQSKCTVLDDKFESQYKLATASLEQNAILKAQVSQAYHKTQEINKQLAQLQSQNQMLRTRLRISQQKVKSNMNLAQELSQSKSLLQKTRMELEGCQQQATRLQTLIDSEAVGLQKQFTILDVQLKSSRLNERRLQAQELNVKRMLDSIRDNVDKAGYIFSRVLQFMKCLGCKKMIRNAVCLAPCGHCYCMDCDQSSVIGFCPLCGPDQSVQSSFKAEVVDALCILMENHNQISQMIEPNTFVC